MVERTANIGPCLTFTIEAPNARYWWWAQQVDATHCTNFSAGVWYYKVFRCTILLSLLCGSEAMIDLLQVQYICDCSSGCLSV